MNKDLNGDTYTIAGENLGALDVHAIPYLLEALDNPDAIVRAEVVARLGRIKDKVAQTELQRRLFHDVDYRVQTEAAIALGAIGDTDVVPILAERLAQLPIPSSSSKTSDTQPTILLVDDLIEMTQLRQLILARGFPCQTITANHGGIGVEQFRAHHPNVVIMNKNMPVMDGYVATRLITDESPLTPVVFISNSAQPRLSRLSGGTDCLTPIMLPGIFLALIKTLCDSRFNSHDNVLKAGIAEALGNIGSEKALSILASLLDDPVITVGVRQEIHVALERAAKRSIPKN